LVEKGGHANYIDGDKNGLINPEKDLTNWSNFYTGLTKLVWSKEDKLYGLKLEYNSLIYKGKLTPFSEFENKFIEKYGTKRKLLNESPSIGSFIKIFNKKFYLTTLGGKPTRAAWHKSNYYDSNEIKPLTFSSILRGIKETGNLLIEKARLAIDSIKDSLFSQTGKVFETVFKGEEKGSGEELIVKEENSDILKSQNKNEEEAKSLITPPNGGFASSSLKAHDKTEITPPPTEIEHQKVYEVEQANNLFKVKKVIDGDTIILENGQEVRYIGINAPEYPNGCFSQEATTKNKNLVEGKQIRIEKDISETDKYGRLLRYVYLDSLFINDYLVRNGYAYDWPFGINIKYKEQFSQAEEEAKESRAGLWGDICHPQFATSSGGAVGGNSGVADEQENQSEDQNQENSQNQDQNQGEDQNQEQEYPEDTTSPIISNIKVSEITENSVLVTWTTDENSNSLVDYGLISNSYDFTISGETLASGSVEFIHTVFLNNLEANSVYYYKVNSIDTSLNQNKAESEEKSFTTLSNNFEPTNSH